MSTMSTQAEQAGRQIAALRRKKNLTQAELGERLHVTFQAVSKWERGEALPDTALLMPLADVLETTVDSLLRGGGKALEFKGKRSAAQMMEGIDCLVRMGQLLGRQNPLYQYAVAGMSEKMNTDIAQMLEDDHLREGLAAEAVIQAMLAGYYFDLSEVRRAFQSDHWFEQVHKYAARCGMV